MMKLVSVLCLVFIAVAFARPTFHTKLLHPGMASPPVDPAKPNNFSHEFHHVDSLGRQIHYKYNVELHDRILHLDLEPNVDAVTCTPNQLTLTVLDPNHPNITKWAVNDLVSGSLEWGCLSAKGRPTVVRRNITAIAREGNKVILSTISARLTQLFKSSQISLKTTKLSHDSLDVHTQSEEAPAPAPARHLLALDVSDETVESQQRVVKPKCCHRIKHAIHDVASAIVKVAKGVVDIATGNINFDKTFSKSIHWNSGHALRLLERAGATFTCEDCSNSITPELTFALSTSSYHLESAEFSIGGSISMTFNTDITLESPLKLPSIEDELEAVHEGEVVVDVGPVPVVIELEIPLTVVTEISAPTSATYTIESGFSGSVSLGVGYNGHWYPIHDASFSHHGSSRRDVVAQSLNVAIALETGLKLVADEVFEIELLSGPELSYGITDDIRGGSCKGTFTESIGVPLEIDGGVELDIHALHLTLVNAVLGPWKLGELGPWDIASGCVYNHRRHLLQDAAPAAPAPCRLWCLL
eukprot:JP445961.1.p1 GENE.JP445961.1~~JP445961.1.p1  ORF type:complete len:528 (+),score=164.74 JP445961.1:19-1602(+)